ncbi:MAG: hypothetical protein LBT69_02210 [Lactobacillales bacterium]|jgi:hypothetical protein|nr:hypothetical protein [Lactobacillales bacterium]
MANRLAHLLKTNKEIANKFKSVKSDEDALAIVKGSISDYTKEELQRDVNELKKATNDGEISEKELSNVAGGAFNFGGFLRDLSGSGALDAAADLVDKGTGAFNKNR